MVVAGCYVSFLLLLLFFSTICHITTSIEQPQNDQNFKPLSILLLHSMLPSHQLSVLALGAELRQRGHNVTLLGPLLEGYEHLNTIAEDDLNLNTIISNHVSKETYHAFTHSSQHNGSLIQWMYNMTLFFTTFSSSQDNYLVKMRQKIDTLNGSSYDYIISEQATMSIMYYVQRKWSTSNIMLLMVILDTTPRFINPWPCPSLLLLSSSGYDIDMSWFGTRFINTLLFGPLEKLLIGTVASSIFVAEHITRLPFSNPLDAVLYQPVLYNTVIGFERLRTLLPLHHYIGPLFVPNSPSLDPELVQWINKDNASNIIYISMGTTGEITSQMAQAFLQLTTHDYRLVWSLRNSNSYVLKGLEIDSHKVYISSWISQFTLLQHHKVKLAILHCGLNGVQESLYNKVPVLCVPYGMDQYTIADRLVYLKLGASLSIKDIISVRKLTDTVHDILVTNALAYQREVQRISSLFKSGGGVKKGADLVELYAEIGYDHCTPSFIRYQWTSVQYYNIDVWLVLITGLVCCILACIKWPCYYYCLKYCSFCCCCMCCKKLCKSKKD